MGSKRKKSQLNKTANDKSSYSESIGDYDDFAEHQDEILLEKAGLGRRSRNQPQNDGYELSDEEVFALKSSADKQDYMYDDDAEEDDYNEDYYGQNGGDNDGEDEDQDTNWGSSKANYYGADEVEDEEDRKLEEQEALRLQKKHLAELGIQDHFDEDDMEEWTKSSQAENSKSAHKTTRESLPEQDLSVLSDQKKLDVLNSLYPEVPLLVKELQTMNEILADMTKNGQTQGDKYSVLCIYIGTLSAYFALFVNTINKGEVNLHNHKVMEGLLKARELWRLVSTQKQDDGEDLDEDIMAESGSDIIHEQDHGASEEEEEEDEEEAVSEEEGEGEGEGEDYNETEQISSKKRVADDEFSVTVPTFKKKKSKVSSSLDDYAEDDDIDVDAKLARKKTLRFYTSKIDQQSKKMEKFSGDLDLPYKDKSAARKLAPQPSSQTTASAADDVDRFSDSGEDQEMGSGGQDADDSYYNEIDAGSKMKKASKKLSHALAVQAAKEGRLKELESENMGEDEKRALSYQILKNKGMVASKKRKEVRNSRVQKRKKYDKALKKLPSKRAVYKPPTTAYGGEATGIKKNVVKSVKFTS